MNIRELLNQRVLQAMRACAVPAELPALIAPGKKAGFGDYQANCAMGAAKAMGTNPRELAGKIVAALELDGIAEKLEIAGPGFINCFIDAGVWHNVLKRIEQQAENYGSVDMGQGAKVMVEFVSANPTGPLHIGHGRGAAVGDAVARVLAFAGFDVSRFLRRKSDDDATKPADRKRSQSSACGSTNRRPGN